MIVDIRNSSGIGLVEWRALRTRFWETNMKIKTKIRAGARNCGPVYHLA
jgi:hypothetical protein